MKSIPAGGLFGRAAHSVQLTVEDNLTTQPNSDAQMDEILAALGRPKIPFAQGGTLAWLSTKTGTSNS
jgi:hypothetical protein